MDTPLRRYFNLPADVTTVDFVHQIDRTSSAESIEKTLVEYQVTPSIERKFDDALGHVQSGLARHRSIFTWIHGSFGCGKSHFMNVLSLLLADEQAVYVTHPELQAARKKFHPAVIGNKLLRLHVQCISRGATTLEEIVFGAAVEELRRLEPERPLPALFEAQKLFASAVQLAKDLPEEKFFGAFPSNRNRTKSSKWGDFGATPPWTRARFDAAIAAPDSNEARLLAGELARTPWLEGIASTTEFVKIGPGLQILAEHVKALGYAGIVLFLDELVLWLSTFQDPKKLALEAPKVSTLVEHGDYPPAIPYLTFAARQRDLSEMTGKFAAGRDEIVFRDELSFWKDRFITLSLEDKDLPRIIEKRVLREASPAAKTEIDGAFEAYQRAFAQDFRQLTGEQGDAEDFRRVYPFSPALVEVMVALSATLQRDRTALRELTNLLVRYLPDFELGKVVPVGDLFDVVANGQTSDLPEIQKLYEQARRVYDTDLLPHIRKKQGTDSDAKCQLLRDEFDGRLGCSGCPERACRTQTRIAKTVLLQGLVPNAPVLKELTASKLVYLNSGTLKSPVPNQETTQAAKMVREWAGITPAIHVQGEVNPQVRAVLDTVDVRRILGFCDELFNEQRRRILVRDILYKRMEVTRKTDSVRKEEVASRTVEWRGRKWRVGFVYDNTRLANDNVFKLGPDEDVRVLIDYPFDEVGYGPESDEEQIRGFLERCSATAPRGYPTIVWLPAFLSPEVQDTLRDHVILDGLLFLNDDDLAKRLPFVRYDELSKVRATLEQQRDHKRVRLESALAAAYGVIAGSEGDLAAGLVPEHRAWLMRPGAKITVAADGLFERSLVKLVESALQVFAPSHPDFKKPATKARLEHVLELFDAILEAPNRTTSFDRVQHEELKAIAEAPALDILRVANETASYVGAFLSAVDKNLAHHKGPLSVGAVRSALDPDQQMSLLPEVEDFLILAYAKAAPRPLRLLAQGQAVTPVLGKLADDVTLAPIDLPSQEEWQRALATAQLFGLVEGKALSASRVEAVAKLAKARATSIGAGTAKKALAALDEWHALAGLKGGAATTQRGEVLGTLEEMVSAVQNAADGLGVVQALARASWRHERGTALIHMATAGALGEMIQVLKSEQLRNQFRAGLNLKNDATHAEMAAKGIEHIGAALALDENIKPLKHVLETEGGRFLRALAAPVPAPLPQTRPVEGFVGGKVAPPLAAATTPPKLYSVASAEQWQVVVAEVEQHLEARKKLRVTIEVVDEPEKP